nr:hypothetical protein [Tanacetum cinerariifolium]
MKFSDPLGKAIIEFGDSYKAPQEKIGKGPASESSVKKKGRTVVITTEDMQKRKNDVKARTTLLLALPDEHQLRFSKLQAIVSNLEFIDVEIKQDDLNHQFLTSLAPEWLIGKGKVHTTSTQVSTASINVVAASINHDTVCAYIASQSNGSQIKYEDINQINEDDIEEMVIKWHMALLSMRAERFWKKTSKKITIQGSDVVGFDKSKVECLNCHKIGHFARECRAPRSQDRENHALVADDEAPTEFALMAKSSSSSENEVYDDSYCSKSCRKNTENLNTKISKLNKELSDCENNLYHYKIGLSQVEARLVEFKTQEIKFCEKIRALERDVEVRNNKIKYLMKSKDLDILLGSQRTDKNNVGLGYSAVPPPTQVYSPPNKDMSWTGLLEFVDDTITDYSSPTPSIDTSSTDSPGVIKTNKTETARKSPVKYAKMYRNSSKSPKVRGNQHCGVWVEKGKTWPKNNFAHKNMTPRAVLLKTGRTSIAVNRTNMNVAQPKMTYVAKIAHSNVRSPFHGKSAVRTQSRVPRVSTVNKKFPTVDSKFSTAKSTFTIDLGNKGKNNIDDKGYWDSGCSRYMTDDISYLSDYEPYDGGYVSFGQGGGKITGKGLLYKINMYSIDLNNVVPHKNLTCLVAKASVNESMLWHRRPGHLNFKTMNKLVRNNPVKDLFGPTYVSSLNHKWYCLVVTEDFSRCDNGGEFKIKEMHELCTKKGIKREFGNAMTPQQNGVAERRIRTLIEAARTMLADAKLPVTFWAEAINTDHLGKFDAKGDEVVVAGSSTNISGTKDVASQAMKKDVDAQDACNADVPESSGISNPTASSKIPPAEQMESLTVESKFPTVSLPVPTVFLDISPKTSNDSRLISKGVFSQEETPSWDNALTLSNRFEYTIGVEANLSNMESSIPASHTPTFRIHKDHPKSQIIGPLDTPVQTRHKSKKIEEHSFIAIIHQKTTLDLLQFCLFSCFLSQEEPKKIFDAPKDPIYQMDSFLYGTIDEEVYVMQPLGFQDLEFPDRVYKLEKAMYGLHQAPRAWYGNLSKYLLDNGFQRGTIDQILFIRKHKGEFLLVQVSANTPMDNENPWGKDGPGKDVELHLYRSMIRSLMYLNASRPDIMFAVCACTRHQVTPKECHLHVVKRIFRYLKGHPKLGLWYPKESPFDLVAYLDNDYGGATQDRKLTTEGCQFLRRRLILWQCKKQTIMATSTTKAEYVAAASGYRQVLWIQNQMLDYGLAFCDYHNMIAILEKTEHNIDFHQIVDFLKASHIRIETMNEETKILTTVDGKPMTIFESLLRRHLKLTDEEGISSLLDTELFEKLSLMGYNMLQNQRFTFQKGQFSHQWKFLIHTIMQCLSSKSTGFNEFSSNIATVVSKALSPVEDEPTSLLRDDSQGEAFPTVFSLDAGQDRENINKTSALPHESSPRVTSLDADEGTQDLEISGLKASVKFLEDKDNGSEEPSQDNGGSIEIREEARVERSTELGSNDTKEMVNVLSFMEAANILTSVVAVVSVSPVAATTIVGVTTVSGLFPTVSAMFTTASVSKPLSKKEQRVFYMSVLRSHAGWKTKHFRVMTLEEIKEKFIPVWKQLEDFVPMSSKEEGERIKRKELKLDQRSAKKMKTSEDASEEDLKGMMQLREYWKIIRLGGHTAVYQFFMTTKDKDKELWVELKRLFEPDIKDQLWTHNQAFMHDPLEWKLYDTCGVHHVFTKDQEIFMLVEKDYPLRKGLATVMICNKLQVE